MELKRDETEVGGRRASRGWRESQDLVGPFESGALAHPHRPANKRSSASLGALLSFYLVELNAQSSLLLLSQLGRFPFGRASARALTSKRAAIIRVLLSTGSL